MEHSSKFLIYLVSLLLFINVHAQKLILNQIEEVELSKTSKKGRYAGTFINDGMFKVLFLTASREDGVQLDQYKFNTSLKYSDVSSNFVDKTTASKEFAWYLPKAKIEKMSPNDEQFISATAAFGGGMKLYLGTLEKHYYLDIYTGMTFKEEKKLKPKTGDIWRILPSGYKSLSKVEQLATDNGFYKELKKFGNPLIAPANAPILAVGAITEKIKTKGPWLSHGNRIAILAIDGTNFDASKYNIYPLPYSAMSLGSGLGQDDNLCALFAPLNAPATVKELKKYLWKDKKNHFTLMRFSDNHELVDSTTFMSKLLWAKFQLFNAQNSTFIIGMGKASFDGWARNANGITLKKVEDIQVSQFKDGKLIYSKLFSEDVLESKLVKPEGAKFSYKFAAPQKENFKEIIALENGDIFALAQSGYGTYALQITPSGNLKAYYRIPRVDNKAQSNLYNYQIEIRGDDVYIVLNEQPFEFSNDAQIETSTTKLANSAGSITTTTVKKLNEVFLQSQIVKINTQTLKISNRVVMDGKNFYTIGSHPAIFLGDAIYFTGRDKGPKGKNVFIARIDL